MSDVNQSFFQKNRPILFSYPIVCAFSIACFWLLGQKSDALGFTLLHLYGLHPLAIVLTSALLAKRSEIGKWALAWPLFMGVCYMATDFMTFQLANTLSCGIFRAPEFVLIAAGLTLSFLGLLIGIILRKIFCKKTQL